MSESDTKFMRAALNEARMASEKKECPIGAVAVHGGKIIGRAHNIRESGQNPLGHAELLLLRKISRKLNGWRLPGVTVYVTLEPCLMCMGALLQARIDRIVFGARDPKAGACGSLYDLSSDRRLNHRIAVTRGLLETKCSRILKDFFKGLRKQNAHR